jgi:hippurate hydrolase
VVGVLKSGDGTGRIGLRADMDALPMQEGVDRPHASKNPGVFHGCGHDGHMAILLGTARHLAETRGFNGTVHFIFQPAEEGKGGAKAMIDDGLFERFDCDRIFGLHNWPAMVPGTVSIRPGPVMAAADLIELTVTGRGGHAAIPDACVDPVVASAQLILACQTIASRISSPLDPVVVSLCQIHGGTANNVIPDVVRLGGTVRTLRPQTRARVEADLKRMAAGIAQTTGTQIELDWQHGYPPTVNHVDEARFAAEVARGIFGDENVETDRPPTMGAEDFSYFLEERPGAYFWLGQGGGGLGCGLHNAGYDFNDSVAPHGVALFSALVRAYLT